MPRSRKTHLTSNQRNQWFLDLPGCLLSGLILPKADSWLGNCSWESSQRAPRPRTRRSLGLGPTRIDRTETGNLWAGTLGAPSRPSKLGSGVSTVKFPVPALPHTDFQEVVGVAPRQCFPPAVTLGLSWFPQVRETPEGSAAPKPGRKKRTRGTLMSGEPSGFLRSTQICIRFQRKWQKCRLYLCPTA